LAAVADAYRRYNAIRTMTAATINAGNGLRRRLIGTALRTGSVVAVPQR
jgi:hypothetical protein